MAKVLLIGRAPSRSAGHERAFDGASGRRLFALLKYYCGPFGEIDADAKFDAFFEHFDTVNVLKRWPGKHGGKYGYREKGDRFPIAKARRAAKRLEKTFFRYPVVVFAGSRTAAAFGHAPEFCTWVDRRDGGIGLVIPHPSGTNLLYNDEGWRYLVASRLSEALKIARARIDRGDLMKRMMHVPYFPRLP